MDDYTVISVMLALTCLGLIIWAMMLIARNARLDEQLREARTIRFEQPASGIKTIRQADGSIIDLETIRTIDKREQEIQLQIKRLDEKERELANRATLLDALLQTNAVITDPALRASIQERAEKVVVALNSFSGHIGGIK